MIKNKKPRISSEGRRELESLRSIDKTPVTRFSDEELESYSRAANPKTHDLDGGFQGNKRRGFAKGGMVRGMGCAKRGGSYK